MRHLKTSMHRYGEPDFDSAYITWGLHSRETQISEAESVLRLIGDGAPLRILDVGCGIGTHAIHWAKHGHDVTGMDISQTFVNRAREEAAREHVTAHFAVCDIRNQDLPSGFDVVTWIEMSLLDRAVIARLHQSLGEGGRLILDVRNSKHPKTKARSGNWRTWHERDGVFTLERHEVNPETGKHEDVWITIDPDKEIIEEKSDTSEPGLKSLDVTMSVLADVGFSSCELRTMTGELFNGGDDPYWLWIVAWK